MDELLIERLVKRDEVESKFSELFDDGVVNDKGLVRNPSQDTLSQVIKQLRQELGEKDFEIRNLKEVINVKNKDFQKLNDEIISLTIENNLTTKKYTELEKEHDMLVKRWVAKVQQDVDRLNAGFA